MNSLEPVLSKTGFELLESFKNLPYCRELAQRLNRGLRQRGVAPKLVAAVLTQLELREAARVKFGDFAREMLFTREGLEQATRLSVAAVHAGRYRDAGCTHVADLGCGLGADSLALAGVGLKVTAYERDEQTAAAALLNLRAFPEATVTQADVTATDWNLLRRSGIDGVFADPARRDQRGRRLEPRSWSPPLPLVLSWRREVPHENLGIKAAPGINYRELPADCEAQWISVGSELVEAGIWLGDLRHTTGRTALLLDAQGHTIANLRDESRAAANAAAAVAHSLDSEDALGEMLWEPDDAIIRAGLLAQVAAETGSKCLSPRIAYLSGDPGSRAWGKRFSVQKVLPLDAKKIRAALKGREVRSLEVKKRGAAISPAKLRQEVLPKAVTDGEDLTLIATRIAGRHRAILAKRL